MYGCEGGSQFAIKSLMKVNPSIFNLGIFFALVLLFTQAIRICEAPLSRVSFDINYSSFINSLWATVTTMATCKLNFNFELIHFLSKLWRCISEDTIRKNNNVRRFFSRGHHYFFNCYYSKESLRNVFC